MAIEKSICIEFVDGLNTNSRRGLAWLIVTPSDKHINAKKTFEGLKDRVKNDVRNRFDAWLSGLIHDKYYHGWNEVGYTDCFVFKYKKNGQHQRLYGFLCHPRINDNRFLLCVLASHTTKNEHEADKSEKDRMNKLKGDENVKQALEDIKKNV